MWCTVQVLARARCHGATVIDSTVLKADASSSVSTTTITSSVTIDRATVEACKVTGWEQHVKRALLVAPQLVAGAVWFSELLVAPRAWVE